MVRTVDYTQRKRAVLAATIGRYIKAAEPIASEDLAESFGLSSATIRNIFKDLEEENLLTHPYTSGGRIPTAKGYRYYVDFLIFQAPRRPILEEKLAPPFPGCSSSAGELSEIEKEHIVREYHNAFRKLESILEKTTDILSAITRYTSIVSFLDEENVLFCKGLSFILDQPEFRNSAVQLQQIVRMIEDKKRLSSIVNRDFDDRVKIYIGEELECPEMEKCSLAVSRYSARKRPSGKIAVLGPVRMDYSHIILSLEYVSRALSETLERI